MVYVNSVYYAAGMYYPRITFSGYVEMKQLLKHKRKKGSKELHLQ